MTDTPSTHYVPAIDRKTITRRRRMAHMAPLHAEARRQGMEPTEGALRKRWREACTLYPGDDGIADETAQAMTEA
jgi:hypothetical protein